VSSTKSGSLTRAAISSASAKSTTATTTASPVSCLSSTGCTGGHHCHTSMLLRWSNTQTCHKILKITFVKPGRTIVEATQSWSRCVRSSTWCGYTVTESPTRIRRTLVPCHTRRGEDFLPSSSPTGTSWDTCNLWSWSSSRIQHRASSSISNVLPGQTLSSTTAAGEKDQFILNSSWTESCCSHC
jgi:hypothetical protein